MRNGHFITDYHCHSTVSPDGHNSMREMALAAAEAGVDDLCFTDHVEPLPWVKWNEPPLAEHSYDWQEMLRQFAEAQEAVGERIALHMGAELGECTMAPHVIDSFLDDAPPLDFTIGSVHTFRAADGSIMDLCWIKSSDEARWYDASERYFDEMERLLDWGRFQVIGHLTLPQRYSKERQGVTLDYDRYEERIRHIMKRAIEKGIGIECNTNRGHQPLPDEKWLRIYHELGGELITLGSDAHTPEYISCKMEERQELLKACGLRYFATFDRKKPIFHKI